MVCLSALVVGVSGLALAQEKPETPRIESVVLAPVQPHVGNPDVIWYDNFDGPESTQALYLEPKVDSPHAKRSTTEALGGKGQSMECFYAKGERGVGNRKLVFGDCPFGRPIRKGEKFDDVYWRIYVKAQKGWTGGGPAKMSRATGFVSSRWNQAFIAHVWGSGPNLTLDPVSGIKDGRPVTTRYNDFDNFKWLGNSPKGTFPIHSTEESGRWICVESRLKLNTPGQEDGYNGLWIDGRLDTERTGKDFRGTYTEHTINAIFLEAYWNSGSPVDQYRWYDDFVVSTKPIGPSTALANPTLIKAPSADCAAWEVEIAADPDGATMIWKSQPINTPGGQVTATPKTGSFLMRLAGKAQLASGPMYFCRVRQQNAAGAWSDWSPWHQPFFVE
jgi:hypothetical protein